MSRVMKVVLVALMMLAGTAAWGASAKGEKGGGDCQKCDSDRKKDDDPVTISDWVENGMGDSKIVRVRNNSRRTPVRICVRYFQVVNAFPIRDGIENCQRVNPGQIFNGDIVTKSVWSGEPMSFKYITRWESL